MTIAEDAAPAPPPAARRRVWRAPPPAADAARAAETGPCARTSLLAKFRASFLRLDAGDTDTESMDCDGDVLDSPLGRDALGGAKPALADADELMADASAEDEEGEEKSAEAADEAMALVRALPAELLSIALSHLDGASLLRCAGTCRALRSLTYDREVWRRLCQREWPTLRSPVLAQLPGAPDYDVIRLYGGSWRACFTERHGREQRAEMSVSIPQFASEEMLAVEKVVSDTFAIGSHRFCLWVFPNGNPNEPQYAGSVLSVYLVLTDLDQRPPDWLTCAVFSLSVANHRSPRDRIEWHSCLVDNKFDRHLNNWGVHALGALSALKDPERGFLGPRDTLTVSASVRLMSITFRVALESDLKAHHDLGLVDLSRADAVVLPFCASLHDLLARLQELYDVDPARARVWCFNQPVVSGQALRPRKLLTAAGVNRHAPMFGHLLSDGVDIDAYSFCQLYVEDDRTDDPPLNATPCAVHEAFAAATTSAPTTTIATTTTTTTTTMADSSNSSSSSNNNSNLDVPGYVFVKLLDPRTRRLEFLGRVFFPSPRALTSALLYEAVARRCACAPSDLLMFKEEIAPLVLSPPVPFSYESIGAQAAVLKTPATTTLLAADIAVFVAQSAAEEGVTAVRALLDAHYAAADELASDSLLTPPPTLADVEELAEKLDIPKFRVRSAFRKCHEDARATLRYIMDGRHLGFICDSCGETDFRGARFNCAECSDYDLCASCFAHRDDVRHRYANVDGKWQRVFDCQEHKASHAMREMLPVFFQRPRPGR